MGIRECVRPAAAGWASLGFLAFVVIIGCRALNAVDDPGKAELNTKETPPSFRVQVQRNLVLARVVVRDSKGNPVNNLRQQDFRLLDNGKAQTITYFSVESPSLNRPRTAKTKDSGADAELNPDESISPFGSLRYMALFFDDVHADFEGLVRTRTAAERYLNTATQPSDRVGVFTSSGQSNLDFTDNRTKIYQALSALQPRPLVLPESDACPDLFPYQAYLIVDRNEQHALEEVTEELIACQYSGDRTYYTQAQSEARGDATRVLMRDVSQSQYTFRGLEALVRRMTALPGQRSIILISPGFFTESEKLTIDEVVDRALRARVVIDALDSKGLYAYVPLGDATKRGFALPSRPDLTGRKALDQTDSVHFDQQVMEQLASETGGIFFQNSNDLDEGFRKVGALPEVAYVLGFSPQNLRYDGRFHTLKVSLSAPARLTVQARRGYFAPRRLQDPAEQEKQDLQEAVFSQDELNARRVDVHTQFFKVNEHETRLAVIAHMDLSLVHFRKQAGRNLNSLTFVTAIFDRDGKYVTAKEKKVDFRLFDTSLDKLAQTGINTRTVFDVAPGTYLVREVVRDSEEGQLSGVNRTVEIPY
jgi:VWFA-related protein